MLRRIGGGSYGEVWLARSVTGALRAVKIVRREDFDLERTFEREFSGIQRYEKVSQDHSGLVDVLHVGRNNKAGFYYYVMELADDADGTPGNDDDEVDIVNYEPRTLASDLAKFGSLSLRFCIETGRTLAGALGHLHRNGLTHRDVKPPNIIFIRGMAKMADIGLVAHSGQRSYVGTEGYVPPEGPGTAIADLYSLAMVLYEMHTGKDRLEFPELPTNLELPRTINRDDWRALNIVICRAGSPDPKKRFENADAFVAALDGIFRSENAKPAEKKRTVWALGMAVILLVVIGLGAWVVIRAFPSDGGELSNSDDPKGPQMSEPSDASTPLTIAGQPKILPNTAPVFQDSSTPGDALETTPGVDTVVGSEVIAGDSMAPTETLPASESEPEPEPEMAHFKINSHPPGVEVWHGGELLNHTPTGQIDLPPGDIELVGRLEGYHDTVVERHMNVGYNALVWMQMREDKRPVAGELWQNSVGLNFTFEGSVDDGGFHISDGEVGSDLVARYRESVGRSDEPLVAIDGAAMIDEDEQWALCDWMTELDRRGGHLSEAEYHKPQASTTAGKERTFFSVIHTGFGSAELTSKPAGAAVYQNGKRLGITPLALDHERAGQLKLSLDLPGYRTAEIKGLIRAGKTAYLSGTLESDDSVVFGEPWTNSIGMSFAPVKEMMVSVFETRVRDYAVFTETETGREHIPLPPLGESLPDHPVVGVGLESARVFCRWLTETERASGHIESYHEYRLPTDLEWSEMAGLEDEGGTTPDERETRGDRNTFPWGTTWPPPPGSGNFFDESTKHRGRRPILKGYNDGFERLAPVGSFDANQYGLYDIAGNVWEWVDDPYGGEGSTYGTLRGGGFNVSERGLLLTAYRNAIPANLSDHIHGFRCVLVEDSGLAETAWPTRH